SWGSILLWSLVFAFTVWIIKIILLKFLANGFAIGDLMPMLPISLIMGLSGFALYQAFFGGLVIDEQGITECGSGYGLVKWGDIQSIEVVKVAQRLGLGVRVTAERRGRLGPFVKFLFKYAANKRDDRASKYDFNLPLRSVYDDKDSEYDAYVDLINRHKRIV